MAKKRSLYGRDFEARVALMALLVMPALTLLDGSLPVGNLTIAADMTTTSPNSVPKKREAWMEASDYSAAHPNVPSFAVNGRAHNATNEQIVHYIQERFASNGVTNSIAFSGREEKVGVSMSFFINGHAYGPVGFANMNATIDQVAGHVRGLQTQ